ncbi:MAG: hypothetical protein ACRDY1_11370, partial [Acidimicrobiales bacterium]
MNGEPAPDDATPADVVTPSDERSGDEPADLRIGAFSSHPPWLVDPEDLSWAVGIDGLRATVGAEAPALTRRRRVPPGLRVVRVG